MFLNNVYQETTIRLWGRRQKPKLRVHSSVSRDVPLRTGRRLDSRFISSSRWTISLRKWATFLLLDPIGPIQLDYSLWRLYPKRRLAYFFSTLSRNWRDSFIGWCPTQFPSILTIFFLDFLLSTSKNGCQKWIQAFPVEECGPVYIALITVSSCFMISRVSFDENLLSWSV